MNRRIFSTGAIAALTLSRAATSHAAQTPVASPEAGGGKVTGDGEDPWVVGDAFDLLGEGTPGEIAPVLISGPAGLLRNEYLLVVQNLTGERVVVDGVSGAARDANDELIATDGFSNVAPPIVDDGAYCLAQVSFDIDELPDDAVCDFVVRAEPMEDDEFYFNIKIAEAELDGELLVGTVENTADVYAESVSVMGFVFNEDGVAYDALSGSADDLLEDTTAEFEARGWIRESGDRFLAAAYSYYSL